MPRDLQKYDDHAPAAHSAVEVLMAPFSVITLDRLPPEVSIPLTEQPVIMTAPSFIAALAIARVAF